ncbi:M23 family metallopeptidase [Actinophytocola algeriensis]|uniref:Murein DD-endopeptidase MepM/ murein hydrolase activator NlpD n=1 Tax=Actinophytocola algeriensis TaxID=1768010 RepID=A0A7W7Q1K9_9PSEU|nr:peptidoglycan DD-metalloendopeptidase family protein [Actinophytocola algeriensis]MBB4905141.1 murein DD-endopeptidase MepM/ murein hydrolase activator NlpD [Actinophytocola algeriensis]MBE1473174.1 murein DD-endopeptidase MepM/ murein hydrolase activator NlpD [Actinophytocola algeriensis]
MFTTLVALLTAATVLTGPSAVAAQPESVEEQIAAADAELTAAQKQLADKFQQFTAAETKLNQLNAAVAKAQDKVTTTRAEADAATTRERDQRVEFDKFASASYRHGSDPFSVRAYVGARDPSDLLDRASMITMLAGKNNDVLSATQAAVAAKSEADRAAQSALTDVTRQRDAANTAKVTAEKAYNGAVAAQDAAKAEVEQLANRRAGLASQSNVIDATGGVALPAQGRLTSTYGARWGTIHYGIDIANSIGTPIYSAMAGEVIDSGPASGFGLWVRVQHAGGVVTVYGHINESLVNVGQQVAAGEQIATIGNRGQSTGPHLHFEVHQDGSKIDPLPWLRSRGVNI